MLRRISSRKNVTILITLAVIIAGFLLINKFFPFISADTDPTTGTELIKKGNFEVVPTFDESVWEKTTNNSKNTSATVSGKRLVLEQIADLTDSYLEIAQNTPLKKGKLYKTTINFETDFPDKLTIVAGTRAKDIDALGKVDITILQDRRLMATSNNKATTFSSYFSPLKDKDNGQFFLKINNGSGKVKIKKISVVECDRSEVGGLFPDIISRFLSGIALIESYYKSIPWRLGEPNSTDGTSSSPLAISSEKAIIFSADVDTLAVDSKPKSDQVISGIKSDIARGENGNNYFSLHAKSELNNLKMSAGELSSPTSPSTLKPNLYSVRFRAKEEDDSSWGTYSYKNELIEPFSELKNLKASNNQSFMLEVPTTAVSVPGEYKGEVTISADGYSKKLPITINVGKFTLENLQAQRALMVPTDERWQKLWNSDPDAGKKKIEAEVRSAFDHGFNSMSFTEHTPNIVGYSMIEQYGRKYPRQMKFDPTNLVSGFNLSDSNKYAISVANQVAKEKNLYVGDNIFSMQTILYYIMFLNGKFGSGLNPSIGSSDYAKIWLELKSESIDGPIANQLMKVMNDIRDQNNTQGDVYKDKLMFYFVDEAGAGSGELDVGLWMDKVAKKAGYKTFFTGNNKLVSATVEKMTAENSVSTYSLAAGDGIPEISAVSLLRGKNITPSLYTGVYTFQDGNRLRNRYISGFFGNNLGINGLLAWQYMAYSGLNRASDSKRLDDFDRKSLNWYDSGRDWNLEYLDDQSYRDSYRNYYGVDINKTDQNQNIPTLQYLGFAEADRDLRYLATAKKVVGASTLPSKTADLTEIDRIASDLPASNRTIYGENISNAILDAKRARLSELIVKHYVYINQPPVLASIGNKEVVAGEKLTFDISAFDPDGDAITYSATGLPSGATLADQKFSWTPSSSQVGSYKVNFKVSDGKLDDSEEITVDVKAVVSPPPPPPDPIFKTGDINHDGRVDLLDLSIIASHWGASGAGQSGGDINSDGIVDLLDLSIVASQWEG
ncbi:MAG: Ig [Candidatus Berkelbacteria bacterium Athens1014_28]|uniref:Ig n=1 Tax=Candidatus Berkelbacteria bacterium Athens1014_28 TaxID=2017145 RepID=A0A554LL59_9BACT|nr:MAG: Ig [Candidatus Berkelbacteria bacterium Athens1014_28]